MRSSKVAFIVAIVAVLIVLLLGLKAGRPEAKLAVSIGVLSYGAWGQADYCVRLGLTNTGPATIRYSQFNINGSGWVLAESPTGWAVRDIGPSAGFPYRPELLRPGSNTFGIISLPSDTLRWQVGYKLSAASVRERVVARIPGKWRNRLYPLCQRLLPGKEGPEQEIQSQVFEGPHKDLETVSGEFPFLLDAGSLLPTDTDTDTVR
jgi:hypothetical protein